jgi:hypothetical protein
LASMMPGTGREARSRGASCRLEQLFLSFGTLCPACAFRMNVLLPTSRVYEISRFH